MTPLIRQVAYARVRPWKSAAARERVDLSDTGATRWFMAEDVGCAGLLPVRLAGGHFAARVRGVFVDPAFRHLGIGTALTEHLIDIAILENAAYVEAFVWSPAWYMARDFVEKGRNGHGALLMRRALTMP